MDKYRVLVSFSDEKNLYRARVAELDGCEAEGATRAEAVERVEAEIAAQVQNIHEQGLEPPPRIEEHEFDGNLTLKVTPDLHRDLVFMARAERVELDLLLTEILARGVSFRSHSRPARPRTEGRDRPREGQGQRYHDIMDDRASFIEYVRSLEGGGGRGGGKGNRGRR